MKNKYKNNYALHTLWKIALIQSMLFLTWVIMKLIYKKMVITDIFMILAYLTIQLGFISAESKVDKYGNHERVK